jgi:hypothetical protein
MVAAHWSFEPRATIPYCRSTAGPVAVGGTKEAGFGTTRVQKPASFRRAGLPAFNSDSETLVRLQE